MSEIRIDIDLEHPPERIWRALTEAKLLSQWLNLPEFTPASEAEVTGIDGERRLAMLWGNGELDTRLIWELAPTPDGTRLTMRQACVYGEWTDELREWLREAYDPVLHERLPAILDWLAFQEVDLSSSAPPATEDASPEPESFASPAPPLKRRSARLAVLAMAALVVGGALVILALRPGDDEPVAASPATSAPASPSPGGPTAIAAIGAGVVEVTPSATVAPSASPTLTIRPSATSRAEATPAPAVPVLSARYATESTLFGYRGEVTVSNTGRAAAGSWTVTITVDPGARVTSDAQFSKDGGTVTFTGGTVGASGSVQFDFEVSDLGADGPDGCQIDGKACTAE